MSEEELRDIQIVAVEFGVVRAPLMKQIRTFVLKFNKKLNIV